MTLIAFQRSKEEGKIEIRGDKFFDEFWHEFIMAVWQKSLPLVVVKWCEYFHKSGGDFQSLARDYFIKNSLNHLRQEFGYANGKYQKMWRNPENQTEFVEDNVVASLLLKNKFNTVEVDSFEEMTQTLRKYYLEYVTI